PPAGITNVIVGTSAADNFDNIRICLSQRAAGGTAARYNIYSFYVNTNQFRSSLNQNTPATAIANCP
ncbi:hypothetical protein, partial [Thermus sp.]|uniref:hypothetical protein n=1 Tax=Thermus sp. TaxID=275 RepID=UPI0025F0D336